MTTSMTKALGKPLETSIPPHNKAGLALVEDEKNKYEMIYWTTGVGGLLSSVVFYTPAGVSLLAVIHHAATKINNLSRIFRVGTKIYEEFSGSTDIQVFPAIVTGEEVEHESIDLYVRFPGRAQLFMSLRSMGNYPIIYNEAKEVLQIKKKRKGLGEVRPCPLIGLSRGQRWLTSKNRHLFGLSSRQAGKTPTARVLVICGKTEISSNHRDELYASIGNNRYLALPKRGTTFVVKEEHIAIFVRDWLAHSVN